MFGLACLKRSVRKQRRSGTDRTTRNKARKKERGLGRAALSNPPFFFYLFLLSRQNYRVLYTTERLEQIMFGPAIGTTIFNKDALYGYLQ